jgi:protein O-GlcNAc transferase
MMPLLENSSIAQDSSSARRERRSRVPRGARRRGQARPRTLVSQLVLALSLVAAVLTGCPEEAGDDFTSVRAYALQQQQRGAGAEAISCFHVAAQYDTSRPEPWLSIGEIFRAAGQYPEAISAFRKCCAIAREGGRPGWALAHFNLANALKDGGEPQEAVANFKMALALDPPFKPAIYNNMALALGALNRNDEVLESYLQALAINPAFPETHNNLASYYQALGQMQEAVEHYRHAVDLRPDRGFMVNLAFTLGAKGDTAASIDVYMKTIELHPDYALAYYNLGTTLMGEERYGESEFCYRWAVKLDGTKADYYNNLATVVGSSGAKPEVMELYKVVLALDPAHETATCNMYHTRHETCDWGQEGEAERYLQNVVRTVTRQLDEGRTPTIRSFHALMYDVPGEFLRRLTEAWSAIAEKEARLMVPQGFAFVVPAAEPAPRRVRIGYTSSDLKMQHPVAHLVAAMFSLHDLLSVEVFCFALSPSDGSPIRSQVEQAAQHFVDLTPALATSLVSAAEEINRFKPHVLVNLNGYTNGGRLELYALRPAPIQVHGVGYPGTMGAQYIANIITDITSSPPETAGYYTEHLIYMPNAYLVNSLRETFPDILHPRYRRPRLDAAGGRETDEFGRQGRAGAAAASEERGLTVRGGIALLEEEEEETRGYLGVSRMEWGLPQDAVVLACFNTLIKLRPAMLRRWVKILQRAPSAVIWLLRAPKTAEDKVLAWWLQHAPDLAHRLIFTDTAAKEDHIRRSVLADLFLDTDIYGAHSTGTDALWSGLPLLTPTYMSSMAARVSGSLMRTVGLAHMVARSLDEYQDLAVALVNNRHALLRVRKRLRRERWESPLFDTRRWMRDWERGVSMLWDAHAGARSSRQHQPPLPVHLVVHDTSGEA